jgi:hypothetical protein
MDYNFLIAKLKELTVLENIKHKDNILEQQSLKLAHIYCKINNLSGQISGNLIEYYIQNKYNIIKNKPNLCIGDFCYNYINYEIKTSFGGKLNNKFNFVQLRTNHNCDYILFAYYINKDNIEKLGELFIFNVPSKNMKDLIYNFGSYAHGTINKNGKISYKDLHDIRNIKEYSIRPVYNGKCWKELLNFRVDDIFI